VVGAAAADPPEVRLNIDHGRLWTTSYDELLDRVNAVAVATPTGTHAHRDGRDALAAFDLALAADEPWRTGGPGPTGGTRMTTKNAGGPISWGVCEVARLSYQLLPARVLAEMREVGHVVTEFGSEGFRPADTREVLAHHDLHAIGGFTQLLHVPDHDPVPEVEALLTTYAATGSDTLVLLAVSGRDGYDTRPVLDEPRLVRAAGQSRPALRDGRRARRARRAAPARQNGGGETARRCSVSSSGSSVALCLDTGHLLTGGTDPAELTRQAPDRIAHTHIRNVDAGLARQVQSDRRSYTEAVREGMYRPVGRGDVDFVAILGHLHRHDYDGRYVLEQDTILIEQPRGEGPVADVRTSVAQLRSLLGGAA